MLTLTGALAAGAVAATRRQVSITWIAAIPGRDLTAGHGDHDPAHGPGGIKWPTLRGKREVERPILAGRQDALQARPQGRSVACQGQLDCLPGQGISLAV